jgi:hypothetical protein
MTPWAVNEILEEARRPCRVWVCRRRRPERLRNTNTIDSMISMARTHRTGCRCAAASRANLGRGLGLAENAILLSGCRYRARG